MSYDRKIRGFIVGCFPPLFPRDFNDVLLDWSRAGLPHPTAPLLLFTPPARDGTVDEVEDLRLCESEGIQPIGDQRYDGMRNGKCL